MKNPNQTVEQLEAVKKEYAQIQMSAAQSAALRQTIENAKKQNTKEAYRKSTRIWFSSAAAILALFLILPNTSANIAYAMEQIPLLGRLVHVVTWRNYQYEDERNYADVEIPELIAATSSHDTLPTEDSASKTETLTKTTATINAEIQEISNHFLEEFETNLQKEYGYQDIIVKSEIINTTESYFTLKLICYQGAGSGAEWNYYYTIDLKTGERLQLKDLFIKGADYITPISEAIKSQMREQMAADENVQYWLEQDIEEWNFKQITDETAFYLDENGKLVISFNEGDVAPMYMGVVTFTIPDEVIADILK